jgi:hypothetical protein
VGDHLKVDIDHVRASAQKIAHVKGAFEGESSTVDSYRDAVGTSILSDKLHSFATNWKIHREKICDSLGNFSSWAGKAADAYDGTEDSLTKVLKDGGKKS